jgi:hypothetical protein
VLAVVGLLEPHLVGTVEPRLLFPHHKEGVPLTAIVNSVGVSQISSEQMDCVLLMDVLEEAPTREL